MQLRQLFFRILSIQQWSLLLLLRVVIFGFVSLLLHLELICFNVLFDLVQGGQALAPKVLELFDRFPDQSFF